MANKWGRQTNMRKMWEIVGQAKTHNDTEFDNRLLLVAPNYFNKPENFAEIDDRAMGYLSIIAYLAGKNPLRYEVVTQPGSLRPVIYGSSLADLMEIIINLLKSARCATSFDQVRSAQK